MTDRAGSLPPIDPIKLVPTKGIPVIVGRRDKAQRIREAIVDLQLVIAGCAAQQPCDPGDVAASLARHCSMFLRKMVVGDDRTPRLLDEETGEPEAVHIMPAGPQRLSIAVEWPLPGMADWLSQPTPENAWKIRPEGLFESQSSPIPDCDAWLGQQLVIFNNRGITLKDVVRVMANTEAAHSPPVQRLMLPTGDEDKTRFRVVKDSEIHILSYITVCGVRYSHAIVIETAMYLYRKLTRNKLIKQPKGAGEILVFGFAPNDVFLPGQNWLHFDGGLGIAFGGGEQSISHRVRDPR